MEASTGSKSHKKKAEYSRQMMNFIRNNNPINRGDLFSLFSSFFNKNRTFPTLDKGVKRRFDETLKGLIGARQIWNSKNIFHIYDNQKRLENKRKIFAETLRLHE